MSFDAATADRLPWLPDEPAPHPARSRGGSPLPWLAAAVAVVSAGGIWIGTRSGHEVAPTDWHRQATTTVLLPPPRAAAPARVQIEPLPEVAPTRVPEARLSREREVRIAAPTPHRLEARSPVKTEALGDALPPAQSEPQRTVPAASVPQPAPQFAFPKPWNPRVLAGAGGRLVQIGAFGSVRQAKRGWWFMVHDYPAMAHLPAVVRETRNSKGRVFYRFDVGTTSQAHSEVLCQRMRKVSLSCAVVGLPWKAKVER
jgi:hypothetical protein